MKCVLAFLFFITFFCAKANDTLTMAQVYNFNVGDTFDYKTVGWNNIFNNYTYYNITFERDIIINEWSDSVLHIVKHVHSTDAAVIDHFDTVVLHHPQRYAIYSDSTCAGSYYIQINSMYNGRVLNLAELGCNGFYAYGYASGLGNVSTYSNFIIQDFVTGSDIGQGGDSMGLMYYSKGSERWGTPYYIVDGQPVVHFTPIPESCAVWNDNVYVYSNATGLVVSEQIKTGNRIPFEGHAYLEMLYTAYNYPNNYFTPDSLIGYFRNDTVNKQTLFYHTLSADSFFAYQFNHIIGENIVAIDTVIINNQRRARWTYAPDQFPFGDAYGTTIQYVEGIGGLIGLVPVYHPCGSGGNNAPITCMFGTLTCFSICGQTIYPNDTAASCPLISGINELSTNPLNIHFYPTLNDGQFQIDITEGHNYKLNIYDILGRQVFNSEVQDGKNFISLKNPNSGIYLWQVMNGEKVIQNGRFVVATQH